MLQVYVIGHLGADASIKEANGKEFTSFRIGHTDKWTDDAGQVHEQTTWVDCIINGKANVLPYLKKGQQVFVSGSISLRVYSSKTDRCMKAGMSVNVRTIELLGGKPDEVPSRLYSTDGTASVDVKKMYCAPGLARPVDDPELIELVDKNGVVFLADRAGMIYKATDQK